MQLLNDSLDFIDFQIGDKEIVLEIDETKLEKNKHYRGHPLNGAWVLSDVERTLQCRVFLVEVPDRTAETLMGIKRTHVLPGSIIMDDCFRGLKYQISQRNRTNYLDEDRIIEENLLDDHLGGFIWRRKHSGDLWGEFIRALQEVIYLKA
ncbi:hypothetical protein RF11_08415 [Thelohanellus kitauei]|uniref:ISXO2-like transposase domain-containing protein n=1 Tax=Thelohanellus kitauei TaxID=669202 RepID=A0A0C2MF98_THEKT|nr:hypothetical protein RF11_08415 [Thelohanellus kitauei]